MFGAISNKKKDKWKKINKVIIIWIITLNYWWKTFLYFDARHYFPPVLCVRLDKQFFITGDKSINLCIWCVTTKFYSSWCKKPALKTDQTKPTSTAIPGISIYIKLQMCVQHWCQYLTLKVHGCSEKRVVQKKRGKQGVCTKPNGRVDGKGREGRRGGCCGGIYLIHLPRTPWRRRSFLAFCL